MARKSFSIHADYYAELRNLPNEQLASLIHALIDWAEDKETTCLDPVSSMLFRLMKAQIERISQTNSVNGKQGGRPAESQKNQKSEECEEKRIKPTVTSTISSTIPISILDTTTNIDGTRIKDKQIKHDKYGKHCTVSLSADEYSNLLSEFGESTLIHYIEYVDDWAYNHPKQIDKKVNWDKVIRKAIAEQWGNNSAKKKKSDTIRTEADYDEPFIRREA